MTKQENIEILRYAKREESYSIAEFLHNCWLTEINVKDLTVDERYKKLLEWYDAEESEVLIIEDCNRIIGATVFGKSRTEGYETDGEISAIYLHSDYIGKGYGHRLFTAAEQALTGKGYSNFILDVLSFNTRAIRFYLAHGYNKVADRQVRLGGKEYPLTVMRKKND